jgi:hypothetical protein
MYLYERAHHVQQIVTILLMVHSKSLLGLHFSLFTQQDDDFHLSSAYSPASSVVGPLHYNYRIHS